MKYQDNILDVSALQPDYLGFIFYEKSSRFFDGDIPELPDSIKKVGVFVDASIQFVLDKIEKYDLQAVQLHGQETPEFCRELKCHYEERSDVVISSKDKDCHITPKSVIRNDISIKIIKVFSIKDSFDFSVLEDYEAVCDYYLFDTKGKLPGGNGYMFDWDLLNGYPSNKPFLLSGGIGLRETENLKKFLKSNASKFCYAIDVNSRFEIEPGLKNIELLTEFKKNVITRSPDASGRRGNLFI